MMAELEGDGKPPEAATSKPIFRDIDADDSEQEVTEMESICMSCYEQGMTRIMLTKIPFFKEVIISSFSCDHCGHMDASVQPGGRIQDRGVRYSVIIRNSKDLNREVVKSDWSTFCIPELEFEQPPSKKGEINTVEGLIDAAVRGLEQDQPQRRVLNAEMADKLDEFIIKLKSLKKLEKEFKILIDDPSGNSFVENPLAPKTDEATVVEHYDRTHAQDVLLGLVADAENLPAADAEEEEEEDAGECSGDAANMKDEADAENLPAADAEEEEEEDAGECSGDAANMKDEVLVFATNCHNCNSPCETHMKLVAVPHFKEVVIMATSCDACGVRENEVKGGAAIEDQGMCITLHVTKAADLSRDVLKADTCGLSVPELELVSEPGNHGGRFTTVEGLLTNVRDDLSSKNPFLFGDSTGNVDAGKVKAFLDKIDAIMRGDVLDFHVILDDPAGNSYLQNPYEPEADPELKVVRYERSNEQNEDLGLNDMKTENYATDAS